MFFCRSGLPPGLSSPLSLSALLEPVYSVQPRHRGDEASEHGPAAQTEGVGREAGSLAQEDRLQIEEEFIFVLLSVGAEEEALRMCDQLLVNPRLHYRLLTLCPAAY